MTLKDITPIMTSNNTPDPYMVICNSENTLGTAWNAFSPNSGIWISSAVPTIENPQYIGIYFGGNFTFCNTIIAKAHSDTANNFPKSFIVQGSNNLNDWYSIKSFENIEKMLNGESRTFYFDNTDLFFAYRLLITERGGNENRNYVNIASLKFYDDTTKSRPIYSSSMVSRKSAYHAQTLPMNTTEKILSKVDDVREGLLGMANDSANYGDLYVVGKDGRSHLTKSGIKSEVIFEGNANAQSILYNMTKNIYNYKYIVILADTGDDSTYNCMVTNTINIEYLKKMTTKKDVLFNANNRYIAITFSDDGLSFSVSSLLNVLGTQCSINRIDGIY